MANVSSSNGLEKYPKLRFKGFSEPWERIKLSDFVSRVTRKNSDNQTDIPLTISSKDGLINQNEFFSKQVASKDMSGYYLLQKGEFAYNKSYSVGFDFGSIKRLEKYDQGALSTLYICFALNRFDSDFIKHYFDSLKWYREIYMISAEGARNHGLLNVPTEDFFATLHTLPMDTAEQKKIADFLDLLTAKIEKQQALVDNLKKYKRGVISKLLDRSIGCDSTPWTSHKVGDFCTVQMCKRIFKEQTSTDGDVPFFKIGTIGSKPDAFISRELFEEYRQKYNYPRKGEFLISCAGTVGKCVIYNGDDSYYQDSNIVWLRNESDFVLNEYLYILVSNVDWSTLNSTTITRIYNDNLRDLVFDFPPIEDQKRISDFYAVLDKRIQAEVSILSNLLDLKQGLIQGLFA